MALYCVSLLAVSMAVLAFVLAVIQNIPFDALAGPVIGLLLMLGLLYWVTEMLPGPVRKVGKAVGHKVWKSMRNKRKSH
jgi:hypothetical protein